MKTKLCFLVVFVTTHLTISQNTINNYPPSSTQSNVISTNGFDFETIPTTTNSDFSEIGSGFFKEKFIMVSSKKVGVLGKIDPNTNEAYKDIYCLDVEDSTGVLSRPLPYSRILNTMANEGQISFTKDEKTAYFTRSPEDNSLVYKLYKADLEEGSNGDWTNEVLLDINKENVSIETPFVNHTGDKLYFSANYPDSVGGFDLYVSNINEDGTLGTPKNLGKTINTEKDEKYPALSLDEKELFFASKGHKNIGGYDLFRSKHSEKGFKTPKNLGSTINTEQDEIAFFFAKENRVYYASNKSGGTGSYDIYIANNHEIIQPLSGIISDLDTKDKLTNTSITLLDEDGLELETVITDENGAYTFNNIEPLENYTIQVNKSGFNTLTVPFYSNNEKRDGTYSLNLELKKDTYKLPLDNIQFDFDKWDIKEEAKPILNKVLKILNEYPKMKLSINGHTDNQGMPSYNLELSKKRASSTLNYLVENGISKNRLKSQGFGETQPLIDCEHQCTEADFKVNRRIEFIKIEE